MMAALTSADVAAYAGADRAERLIAGAKREGMLTVYTSAAIDDMALVAAASQGELDAGRRFCFLFTSLANPTSNHIYQTIGYEPVRDVDAWRFDRG